MLTTPLLAELAARGPVDVVVTPAAAPMLATHPAVRRIFTYDKDGAGRGPAALWALARRIRRFRDETGDAARPAVAYLAQGSIRSALLARLAGYPTRVGFASSAGRLLYTHTVPYAADHHHAARLASLADGWPGVPRDAGATPPIRIDDWRRPRLYPSPADVAAVDAVLRAAGAANEPLIALAPGSIWGTKRWPGYAALAGALASEGRIVAVGSAADAPAAAAIADALGAGRLVDATGRLSILASAELIGRARVLVTNDSAPQHLASAMGTPTVTVFGPTVPAFGFGPLAARHAVAQVTTLPCRPCDRHGPRRCPLGHWRCMRDLAVEQVAALARDVATPIGS